MKKDYKHPRFKAVELKMKGNLLEWSDTTDNSAGDNGGTTTKASVNNLTVGGDDGTAAAKGFSWSFDDDY